MTRRATDLSAEVINFCYMPKPKPDPAKPRGRKTAARRLLGILSTVSVAAALVVLSVFTSAGTWVSKTLASAFCVRQVLIEGVGDLDGENISKVCLSVLGRSLFSISSQDLNGSLEAIPTVRQAALVKRYPDTLVIRIGQREPVLRIEVGDKVLGLSADGMVLPLKDKHHSAGLPLAKGLELSGAEPGAQVKGAFFGQLLNLCELFSTSGAGELGPGSVIKAVDQMEVHVKLERHGPTLVFSLDDTRRQIEKYVRVRPSLTGQVDESGFVDLRFRGQVLLRKCCG